MYESPLRLLRKVVRVTTRYVFFTPSRLRGSDSPAVLAGRSRRSRRLVAFSGEIMETTTGYAAPTYAPPTAAGGRPHLDAKPSMATIAIFIGLLLGALIYVGYSVTSDISASGAEASKQLPFALLGIALLVALGFEFVNGFHDTANAVATVI